MQEGSTNGQNDQPATRYQYYIENPMPEEAILTRKSQDPEYHKSLSSLTN